MRMLFRKLFFFSEFPNFFFFNNVKLTRVHYKRGLSFDRKPTFTYGPFTTYVFFYIWAHYGPFTISGSMCSFIYGHIDFFFSHAIKITNFSYLLYARTKPDQNQSDCSFYFEGHKNA